MKNTDKQIKEAIKAAVDEAFKAGQLHAAQSQKDSYRATERRLYALPMLKDKLASDIADLQRLQTEQAPDIICRSADILRFRRSGVRITDEELLEMQLTNLQAQIASSEYEISTIEKGLARISDDYYYRAIPAKYFEKISDDDIAELLSCDASTVRRNRSRLVRCVAIWLYGTEAI